MKKTFEFGKIAVDGKRKINLATVEMELKEKDGKEVLSISGNAWNSKHTDIVIGGQCLDELKKHIHTDTFKTIYRLWKSYHLNDMHAGTIEQDKAIDEWKTLGNKYEYTAVCEFLKSIDMYEVEVDGKPYKYGHGWLYREIPSEDLEIIKSLLQ